MGAVDNLALSSLKAPPTRFLVPEKLDLDRGEGSEGSGDSTVTPD